MKSADTKRPVIVIDTSAVPDCVRDNMAEKVLDGVRSFFANPDHAAGYRQWLAERYGHAPNNEEKESG